MKITLFHVIGILFFLKIGTQTVFGEHFVDEHTTFLASDIYDKDRNPNIKSTLKEEEIFYLANATPISKKDTNSVSFLNFPAENSTIASGVITYAKQTATGAGNGSDWDNAIGPGDLETAIEAGGLVYMAAGTYAPGNEINITNPGCIVGGFPASSTGTDTCSYDPITNVTEITGANTHRLFHNNVTVSTFEMRGLVLKNGTVTGGGAAFAMDQTTTMSFDYTFRDMVFKFNTSTIDGALYITHKNNASMKLTIDNCIFFDNNAARGGAISIIDVRNNVSGTDNGLLVINNCTFNSNTSTTNGGGAINIEQANNWTIKNSTFCSNDATQDGGALRLNTVNFIEIENTDFTANTCDSDGGAIHHYSTSSNITNCDFTGNNAGNTDRGGAIFAMNNSEMGISNSYLHNNSAGSGGALYLRESAAGVPSFNILNCNFTSNDALENAAISSNGGGAIKGFQASALVEDCNFVDNTVGAAAFGGAIHLYQADFELENNLFYNNLKGSSNSVLGADILNYNNGGSFDPMANNKMQLATDPTYVNQSGGTNGTSYNFTNDTFNNTDDGSLPAAPTITCATDVTLTGISPACPEICGNGIDDDLDGYIDVDDSDCITTDACGCPSGATTYSSIGAWHSVPAGEVHCLTGTSLLNDPSNNLFLDGTLYIVDGGKLTINGGYNSGVNGKIIICENSSFIHNEGFNNMSTNFYNFGILELCGTNLTVDSIAMGANALTAVNGTSVTLGQFAFQGLPGESTYLWVDGTTIDGVSTGNVCVAGGTPEMITEFHNSVTPTCVTNCSGCSELSSITETCNDGSVETAYLGINLPPLEICGNGIDDNGDGRIDEAYPGGIQNNLHLWLDGETGMNTITTGADVTSWADQSINGYSANADSKSTDNPTYLNNAINYHPGVNFDGTYSDLYSDGLHLGSDYIYSENGGMQIFSVIEHETTGNSFGNVYDFGHGASEVVGLNWTHIYSKNQTPTAHGGEDEFFFHHTGSQPLLASLEIDFETDQTLLKNGTVLQTTAIPGLSQISASEIAEVDTFGNVSAGPVTIGRQSSSSALSQNRIFNGAISEVLVYNDTLSQSDQEKVNSYLAVKYGLTLSHNYYFSDGTLIKDISDGYANNIAGIGLDSCGALIQKQSLSVLDSSIISIALGNFSASNTTNLSSFNSDKSALIWGNDGAAENASWDGTNYDIPNGGYLGIDRVWKLDETQDVGGVTLSVDVDDSDFDLPVMPPYPGADGFYYLFLDDDGDFTNGGTTIQIMTFDSGSLWETTIDDPTTSYFSIGIKVPEICNDGIDNDGDGDIDCQDADCETEYYATSVVANNGLGFSTNILGSPDISSVSIGDGEGLTVDLGSEMEIGEMYTIRFTSSLNSSLTIEESIDGINFFPNSASPHSTTIFSGTDVEFITTHYTRYIRFSNTASSGGVANIDAISYNNCICQSATTLDGEYAINSDPDILGDSVTINQGDSLTLDFVGIFNSGVFIWTKPDSSYQVTDSGLQRDHLDLGNIQTNQAGTYKVIFIDTLSCIDTASFVVDVVVPEICGNGIDEDGDGDIDCADSDCNTTYYAASQTSTSVGLPANILGAPDGQEASFGNTSQMVLDLGSALDIGEDYTLTLRYVFAAGNIVIEESIDGINFFNSTNSPFTIPSNTLTNAVFTTSVHTRYLRLSYTAGVFAIDAVTYGNCLCQPTATVTEEYKINTDPYVAGNMVNLFEGDRVRLEFAGVGFNTWTLIWTGPNSYYRINDSGTQRDRIVLDNIQLNQAGVYKVVYFDDVGCVDSTSFTVNVSLPPPEICDNGIDDDGDGDIDCADADCPAFADSDNDLICDAADLDDDNDGIPDLSEGCLTDSILIWNEITPAFANVSGGTPSADQSVSYTNTDGTFDYTLHVDNPDDNTFNQVSLGSYQVLGFDAIGLDSLEDFVELTIDIDNVSGVVLQEVSFAIDDIDRGGNASTREVVNILGYNGVTAISPTVTAQQTGFLVISPPDVNQWVSTTTTSNANLPFLPGTSNVDGTAEQAAIDVAFNQPIDKIVIRYSQTGLLSGGGIGLRTIFGSYCIDTDGDGVANSLDLDSDNDGVLDIDEAGHGEADTNVDGIIDGLPASFGANGLFDGVETVADNGTLNYVISDSEAIPDGIYDAYELDADGDTCFDALETAVTDGDADGIAGTGIPTVDGNGLVDTNTYAAPSNNEWQNSSSCSASCNTQAPVLTK